MEGDMLGPIDQVCFGEYNFAICDDFNCHKTTDCRSCAGKPKCKWDIQLKKCLLDYMTSNSGFIKRDNIIQC